MKCLSAVFVIYNDSCLKMVLDDPAGRMRRHAVYNDSCLKMVLGGHIGSYLFSNPLFFLVKLCYTVVDHRKSILLYGYISCGDLFPQDSSTNIYGIRKSDFVLLK